MPLNKSTLTQKVSELKNNMIKKNFKQSIELQISLKDLDLKKTESRMEFPVEIPHPITKPVKICVIASGDLATRAKKTGAELILEKENLEELGKDKKKAKQIADEYVHFIAEASLMPLVGKTLGAILGPRGRMPTPVPPTASIEEIIEKHRRTIKIRIREQPAVRCRVATEDMVDEQITENVHAVFTSVESKLPKGEKNIDKLKIKTTMGEPLTIPLK